MTTMRLLLLGLLLAVSAPAAAAVIALRNVTLHAGTGAAPVAKATIVIRDDRILAAGVDVVVPEGARSVDGRGGFVTPALFDAFAQIGLKEIDGVLESADMASDDARFGAAIDVVDGLNPRSTLVAVNRSEGLLHALAAPLADGKNLIAGRAAVIDLGNPREFLTRAQAALVVQAGEVAATAIGGSRMAALALLREAFEQVRKPELWTGHPNREALLSPLDVEALRPVLAGEVPVLALAHRAADIRSLLRLADDFGLRLIIRGGAEAHLVAAELAAKSVPVILDPTYTLPSRFETLAARADAPQRLLRAGVLFAFSGADDGGHNSRNIRQLAGNAVAQGLAPAAALAAITLNPARIFGLDFTLGSIEAGKVADLVLWDGDPLELTSFPREVYSRGRLLPADNRQTALRDRYLAKPRRPAATAPAP